MIDTRSTRLAALLICALLFGGTLIAAGVTLTPDPTRNDFPNEDDLVASDVAPGDRVTIGGTVRSTDPLVIEADPTFADPIELTVTNVASAVSIGDEIVVHGTLTDEWTIRATGNYAREPWELYYMYAVSAIAGLWVLSRFLRGWQLDRSTGGFRPRANERGDRSGGDR
ncbi:hypothetical protein [Halalkalirubrum salinum]|uniref:hypothetical protein n=1 Tax=Halalkalirubrum salinum TaxID=2563889 RepID=UPI0010FB2192|nr:hypothetical protein [Halalkalirubrum salinum]